MFQFKRTTYNYKYALIGEARDALIGPYLVSQSCNSELIFTWVTRWNIPTVFN